MIRHIALQQHKVHYQHYFLLLVICLLAFWPLSFGLFSVKNDAIHYYLPYRFQVSEAIQNGEWPFWSPYIYLGYPIMGDMQSGAWNPIVWFFSLWGRYDLTVFHIETLLYIFLAGVGMYKLVNRLFGHAQTALLIGTAYMLSGFMLSGQLINWLAAAAFFPFVINYYLQSLRSLSVLAPLKTGVALFLLFTTGYPSFFIITGYILVLLFMIRLADITRKNTASPVNWKKLLLFQMLVLAVFLGLAAPAIISYVDLLPYYQRGQATTYQATIVNSFEIQHLLSLVFPSTVQANDIASATDITCRNIYIGLFPLILLVAIPPQLNRRTILLSILAIGALLFSLGDATPFRKFCYNVIPLMDTFRHPSQMRLFLVFALLLLSAGPVKKILNNELSPSSLKKLNYTIWITGTILLITTIIFLSRSNIGQLIREQGLFASRSVIKNLLDSFSLADAIVLNGAIQLVFTIALGIIVTKRLRFKKFFIFLWIFNLFLLIQPVLPSTFVSKTSPRDINRLIHASPKGFPVQGLERSLAENSKDALAHFDLIALSYFYNKKIGISSITNSPSFLNQQGQFLNSRLNGYVASLPVAYLAGSVVPLTDTIVLDKPGACKYAFTDSLPGQMTSCEPGDTIMLKKISANHFEVATQTKAESYFVLTQNYHHSWQAWIDGKQVPVFKTNISFMGIRTPAGQHEIIFRFVPKTTLAGIWIMLATVLAIIITTALILKNRSRKIS